jgi:ABC-type transport system involved in cytochrome c biogenesis ATPase subunit
LASAGLDVLRGASLHVEAGELVGLVGENGSGKSVLMRIIVGVLARDAGTVERPARLGYCPQVPLLWDKLTIDEHFLVFAEAYGLDDAAAARTRDELLEELSFAKSIGYRVEDLSGGTRQKLNLALALLHMPELLLLDEPYAGFDWETSCASGRWPRSAAGRAWGFSSSATAGRARAAHTRLRAPRRSLRSRMTRTAAFAREQLRAPFTLALLVAVPTVFVFVSSGVLADFAEALGGGLAADAASALSAGWAAAFIAGTLGFFQAASSRGADRRLALAGAGPYSVAVSRISASLALALVAAAAGFAALVLRTGVAHPWHAAAAVLAFALIYVAVGIVIGSLIASPLEGSLAVAFVFLLDMFSGPGMAEQAAPYSLSCKAADILITAGLGRGSSGEDWLKLAAVVAAALAVSLAAFAWTARRRA